MKLEALGYHMVKTGSVYLTWPWIRTGSWQTDRQRDRIPIANTRSQQYLPVQLSRVKTTQKWCNNILVLLVVTVSYATDMNCKIVVSTKLHTWCTTDLYSLLGRASGRPHAVPCAVVCQGSTGRQHQVHGWLCLARSQRLGPGDLSETGLTGVLWVSARYVGTCEQPRYVRPDGETTRCTARVVRLNSTHKILLYRLQTNKIHVSTSLWYCHVWWEIKTHWAILVDLIRFPTENCRESCLYTVSTFANLSIRSVVPFPGS